MCVAVFFMINQETPHANSNGTVIQVNKDTAVYDNRTGSLVQVGTLTAEQTFIITKDYSANWWQIRWGEHFGYVSKYNSTIVPKVNYTNKLAPQSNAKTIVKAKVTAPIYDNSSGALVQFATLMENTTFPIYSKSGNWYGLEVNGRLGFVHNSAVGELPNPSYKPQVEGNYVQALVDTPLYDFRREKKTMAIATLMKGQQVSVIDSSDAKYVKLRWGKTYLYAEKSKVKFVKSPAYKNVGNDQSVKNQYFIPTKSNSYVYDRPNGKAVAFAKLDTNHRFPILKKVGNWYVTTIGGREGYIESSKVALDRGVPVLMYHHILKAKELGRFKNVSTTITDVQFANEMQYLKSKNYETVSMQDFQRYMRNEITLPANSVVLTFDDGLLSTREYAYPILKKHGFKATQFLITYRNERAPIIQTFNPLTLQFYSIQDMKNLSDVFAYESHTYNLHEMVGNKGKMLLVPYREVTQDLKKNLRLIPQSKAFAYPFGQYTKNTIYALQEVGYTMAFSTIPGHNLPYGDLYQIKRLFSHQKTTSAQYQQMVSPYAK